MSKRQTGRLTDQHVTTGGVVGIFGKDAQVHDKFVGKASLNVTAWNEGKLPAFSTKSGRLHQGIRRILLKSVGNKCSQCGWNEVNSTSNKCPLEIDHIDGNSANCDPTNLRVLCPNCHSLTPTYKALNRGNGNRSRLSYSKLIPLIFLLCCALTIR